MLYTIGRFCALALLFAISAAWGASSEGSRSCLSLLDDLVFADNPVFINVNSRVKTGVDEGGAIQMSQVRLMASQVFRDRDVVLLGDQPDHERQALCDRLLQEGYRNVTFLQESPGELFWSGGFPARKPLPSQASLISPQQAHRLLSQFQYPGVFLGDASSVYLPGDIEPVADQSLLISMLAHSGGGSMVVFAATPNDVTEDLRETAGLFLVEGGWGAWAEYQQILEAQGRGRYLVQRMCRA